MVTPKVYRDSPAGDYPFCPVLTKRKNADETTETDSHGLRTNRVDKVCSLRYYFDIKLFDIERTMGTHYQGTPAEQSALNSYIKLSRAAEAVGQRINDHLKAAHLTISQFGVLEALYHLGPLQPGQLAEKILKSSGNLTLVIDNLVKRGLVQRQRRADDRRCIDIQLTPAGRDLIADLMPGHVAGVVAAFAPLTPEEQAQLGDLCRRLGLAQQET